MLGKLTLEVLPEEMGCEMHLKLATAAYSFNFE